MGGIPPRPSRSEAPPPCSARAEASKKLRRGEWLTKAPFGYVNNTKTRTIEPHPTLSKVIVRAFEEFATGKYTLGSLAEFLAELGLETKNRTPLAKASVSRMLTNQAYLGLVKHKGEYHEGSFEPILSQNGESCDWWT